MILKNSKTINEVYEICMSLEIAILNNNKLKYRIEMSEFSDNYKLYVNEWRTLFYTTVIRKAF